MKNVLKVANIFAILGTALMGFVVVMVRVSPGFIRSLGSRGPILTTLAFTEVIFTFSLLFFFAVLHFYNAAGRKELVSSKATLAAIITTAWMSIVAVLHRFPSIWRWVATRESGLIVSLTQVIFTIPLLFFFVLFSSSINRQHCTLRLRVASVVAIIGSAWLLIVSAVRVSPVVWIWLIEKGAGRIMIITEPFLAISFLIFLFAFLFESHLSS
jgi:hypothetical protein